MEAIGVIDILRRADIEVVIVSIANNLEVTGAHNIKVICDENFNNIEFSEFKMIIFPGGVQGVKNIREMETIKKVVNYFYSSDRYVAAICAAPTILGDAGVLDGNNYTCYEGFQDLIDRGFYLNEKLVQSNNIITSNCAGSVFEFGLKLVELLKDEEISKQVRDKIILK